MTLGFSKALVRDAKFEIKSGLITGIVGPSSSGKSTILDIISLHRYEKQCEYTFNGLDLKTISNNKLDLIKQQDMAYFK